MVRKWVLACSLALSAVFLFLIREFVVPASAFDTRWLQELGVLDSVLGVVLSYIALASLFGKLLFLGINRTPLVGSKRVARDRSFRVVEQVAIHSLVALLALGCYSFFVDNLIKNHVECFLAFLLGFSAALPTLVSLNRRGIALRKITDMIGSFAAWGFSPQRRREYYSVRLRKTLELIVKISLRLSFWRRWLGSYNAPTALLFVPDHEKNCFVFVSGFSCVRDFGERISSEREPPALDFGAVCEVYNRYCEEIGTNEIDPLERVRQFRKDTRDISSTCGIVAEYRSPFIFDNVFSECLTFDFDFLHEIGRREDQKKLEFEHLVGIPARFDGKLLGVVLLLSDSTARFVRDRRFYEQFMDILGHALNIGLVTGSFPDEVLRALSTCKSFESPNKVTFRHLLKSMNSRFEKRLEKSLLDQYHLKSRISSGELVGEDVVGCNEGASMPRALGENK